MVITADDLGMAHILHDVQLTVARNQGDIAMQNAKPAKSEPEKPWTLAGLMGWDE